MSWVGLAVGGLTGGLVALVAAPVVKRLFKEQTAQNVVYAVLFFGALAISREAVQPHAERWYAAHTLEESFLKNPAISAIKAYEPATYATLIREAKDKVLAGANEATLTSASNAVVQPLILKRVPTASDAAAVQYIKVTMEEIRLLLGKGGDLCYLAMFPEPGFSTFSQLPQSMRDADLNAVAEVLRSAIVEPRPMPTESDFQRAVGPTGLAGLDKDYHPDLDHLAEPKHTQKERRRACEVTLAVYDELFKLPKERAGIAVRYIVSLAN